MVAAASRLAHVGIGTLATAAAIVGVAAIALGMRKLWAHGFALLACSLGTLGAVALVVIAAPMWASGSGRGDRFLEVLLWGAATVIIIGFGLMFLFCAVSLFVGMPSAARGHSASARAGAVALAIALFGLCAWLVGFQYGNRQLWKQDACLGGSGEACHELAHLDAAMTDAKPDAWPRFRPAERLQFSRRGCALGYSRSCSDLAAAIGAARLPMVEADADGVVDEVARHCKAGDPQLCIELGRALFRVGARARAEIVLESVCQAKADWCEPAAELALTQRAGPLAQALRTSGCDRDAASSCRGLIWHGTPSPDAAVQARLELKSCLIGDVNDCTRLIKRDLRGACPQICAGRTELRGQSCWHCASAARDAGLVTLAEAWRSDACAAGYRADCAAKEARAAVIGKTYDLVVK
ncbi:MAG: hypothetical protein M3Z16_06480 [Pseudomonadota bacterium]|nr:hypothetical protein [Pseudomonadota bacterium]